MAPPSPPPPPPEPASASPPAAEPAPAPEAGPDQPTVESPAAKPPLNLNEATYEQLRERSLSVTQTGRVLAYRDRVGGFTSLDELDSIPGFPHSFLEELKRNLTV
jgi:DNA uptake protein ComE-like DNA-binding protein